MPDSWGSMMSSSTRSKLAGQGPLQAGAAVKGLFHLVALVPKLQLHHAGQLFLVLHQKDRFSHSTFTSFKGGAQTPPGSLRAAPGCAAHFFRPPDFSCWDLSSSITCRPTSAAVSATEPMTPFRASSSRSGPVT